MRRDRACSSGTRSSALWGRGSKSESRSSALWGRRGGRTSVVVAAALALALPVAGIAGSKKSGPAGPMIPPSLLSAAQANPKATFNVILMGVPGVSASALGQNVNQGINANRQDGKNNQDGHDGKLKRTFSHLTSVSATLTGK